MRKDKCRSPDYVANAFTNWSPHEYNVVCTNTHKQNAGAPCLGYLCDMYVCRWVGYQPFQWGDDLTQLMIYDTVDLVCEMFCLQKNRFIGLCLDIFKA